MIEQTETQELPTETKRGPGRPRKYIPDPEPEVELITTPSLSIVEQQERANIDMLVATARKYPRDLVRVKRNMEAMATLDEETAQACNYHLERDGHSIDGPSVRMAEIAVSCYQNIRAGSRVI